MKNFQCFKMPYEFACNNPVSNVKKFKQSIKKCMRLVLCIDTSGSICISRRYRY